jgi:hypothetical protein
MVALLARPADLALDPAPLQLQDAHAQHRLALGRLLLRRMHDLVHQRPQGRIGIREARERVVERRRKVVARLAQRVR